MARPVCKRFLSTWSDQSASTYPVSGSNPGQDGDPRVPVPHKGAGIECHFTPQACRNAGRLSGHLASTTRRPSYGLRRRVIVAGRSPRPMPPRSLPASKPVSLRSTAQAIRASLLASATTTVLTWARASRPRNQAPSGVCRLRQRRQGGAGAVDEQLAQVLVAALGDPEQLRLAARGRLAGHQAKPGRKVSAAAERSCVADCRHQSGRVQYADAGDRCQAAGCWVIARHVRRTRHRRLRSAGRAHAIRSRMSFEQKPHTRPDCAVVWCSADNAST